MKKNVLFYYPQHFNRSEEGTNPFFDPLLDTCNKYGISYDLLEEPDGGTDKPRNPKAKQADVFFWTVTVIRKIFSILLKKKDFYQREKFVAKTLNWLTFNKYKYDRYVTISGSMFHLFASLNTKGKVFDLQHGVVYKHHPTFFEEENLKLKPYFYNSQLNFLFWGKGYEDCFIRGEEDILRGRTFIIGYPEKLARGGDMERFKKNEENKWIVISLQFTHSITMEERIQQKELLWQFLEQIENLGYEVLLKNHPRYNKSIEIDDIFNRFKNVKLTSHTLEYLSQNALLHVTFYSTTAFEFASYGIPTYFLYNKEQPIGETLFKGEYGYPLYWNLSIENVVKKLCNPDNRKEDSNLVLEWYNKFYASFNEKSFIKALAFNQ